MHRARSRPMPPSSPSRPIVPLAIVRALAVTLSITSALYSAKAHEALEQRFSDLFAQVAKHPDDASLYYQLADLHVQHEDWAAALASVEVVERLAPNEYATEPLRGQALALAGEPQRAREAYDRFLAAHPESVRVLILRARLRNAQGEPEGWIEDLRAALARSAKPEPDLVIETVEALDKLGRPDEAIAQLDDGIRRLGSLPVFIERAVQWEVTHGRVDAALRRLAAMEKSALRPEPWIAQQARVLAQAGRDVEARSAWRALLASIEATPPSIRGSHAMNLLAEQARQGIGAP